jgi:hypothetical protein
LRGRYAVKLSLGAAEALDRLPRQNRGRLLMSLRNLASHGHVPDGLFKLAAWRTVAACEASPAVAVVLVYAIVDWHELYRELVGEAIARRANMAGVRRTMRRRISAF